MNEGCHNPLCSKPIESSPVSGGWRRTPKRFCSDGCKTDGWALKRAAELLSPLPAERKLEILAALLSANGNQHAINGNNQWKINRKKTYIYAKWPCLAIGKRVKFEGGLFETDDPELQKMIEGNEAFGVQILGA